MIQVHLMNYIWWAIKIIICSFVDFLSLQLNKFLLSEIKQNLSSVQKTSCINEIADKK